jgi:hypothetical protein
MHIFKAHVKDGKIQLDEPADLPEGAKLEVTLVAVDDMSPELHQALERSVKQMKGGQLIDSEAVRKKLRALREG